MASNFFILECWHGCDGCGDGCSLVTNGGDGCGVVTDGGNGCGVVTDGGDGCDGCGDGCSLVTDVGDGCGVVTDGGDGCGPTRWRNSVPFQIVQATLILVHWHRVYVFMERRF